MDEGGPQRTESVCPRRHRHRRAAVVRCPFLPRRRGSGLLCEIEQVLKVGSTVYTTQAKRNRAGWVGARGPAADRTSKVVGASSGFQGFVYLSSL